MIKFDCLSCSIALRAADEKAGERIICPRCRRTVTVPLNLPKSEDSTDEVADPRAPRRLLGIPVLGWVIGGASLMLFAVVAATVGVVLSHRKTPESNAVTVESTNHGKASPSRSTTGPTPEQPAPPPNSFLLGQDAVKRKEWDRGIAEFTAAIRAQPDQAEAYHWRGMCFQVKGDLEAALADMTKAVDLDPRNALILLGRARLLIDRREIEAAIADCTTVLAIKSDCLPAYLHRAQLYGPGKHDAAIADYTSAIRLDPSCAEAYKGRARAWAALDDFTASRSESGLVPPLDLSRLYEKAMADQGEAIRLNPKDLDPWRERALLRARRGEFRKAEADYTVVLSLSTGDATTYHLRGTVRLRLQDWSGASRDFAQVLAFNPKDDVAHYQRGMALLGQSSYKPYQMPPGSPIDPQIPEAVRSFSTAIELNPRVAGYRTARGLAYVSAQDYEKAMADFEAAIKINPGWTGIPPPATGFSGPPNAFDNATGTSPDPRNLLARPDPTGPGTPLEAAVAYSGRGTVNAARKQHRAAVEDYSKAIQLNPAMADYYLRRASSYTSLGEKDRAAEDLTTAARLGGLIKR